ncbi:6370_t:CDS:1, partial [Gigaspora margarita]
MANPNQPTPSFDLVNQLAQLLQQLQVVLTSNQTEFHQKSWKEPRYTPIVRPQHLQQQCPQIHQRHNEYHNKPKERVDSQAIPKKQCP